ncbi:MAG: acylphosphatase [Alphaproteobacteria bacterium]|nr:acylphosphatase [Alphaproteobacteria bacterium]
MAEKCLKVSGRVQGVGFRFWAARLARSIGDISGYACNLPDGDVLVLLSGAADKIDEMHIKLYAGPLFARVDKIVETPELKLLLPPVENGVFKRI